VVQTDHGAELVQPSDEERVAVQGMQLAKAVPAAMEALTPGAIPAFMALGAFTVTDDGHRLAYATDVTGFREYTLFVKDLASGALAPERIERVAAVAWSADPRVFFYVTEDDAKRPYRLWRHRLGTAADELVYEETDGLFRLHVERSRSRRWLFLTSASFTSTEVRCLPAAAPGGAWRAILPREPDHEYEVDHGVGCLEDPAHQIGHAGHGGIGTVAAVVAVVRLHKGSHDFGRGAGGVVGRKAHQGVSSIR